MSNMSYHNFTLMIIQKDIKPLPKKDFWYIIETYYRPYFIKHLTAGCIRRQHLISLYATNDMLNNPIIYKHLDVLRFLKSFYHLSRYIQKNINTFYEKDIYICMGYKTHSFYNETKKLTTHIKNTITNDNVLYKRIVRFMMYNETCHFDLLVRAIVSDVILK